MRVNFDKFGPLIFGVLPIIVVIAIEPLYRDSLYAKTLAEVPRMQSKKKLFGFFNGISMIGEAQVPLIGLLVVFNLINKIKALYLWAAFGLVCFINTGVLKTLYEEPRPFWVQDDITP
jgi:hypothetical protein